MTKRSVFDLAHEEWKRLQSKNTELDDLDFEALMRAETVILLHHPRDPAEAARMLDVVSDSVGPGQRSDGLDAAALERLQAWFRAQAGGDAVPSARRRAA